MNLISGEGKHSVALFHNSNQDVRMAVHGDDCCMFFRRSRTQSHRLTLLKLKNTAKEVGTIGFQDSDAKRLLLLNRVFRVGTDQTGQFVDIEPNLRHAPLIIKESGCNANTKTVSTPRDKLQDKLVLH